MNPAKSTENMRFKTFFFISFPPSFYLYDKRLAPKGTYQRLTSVIFLQILFAMTTIPSPTMPCIRPMAEA